MRTHCPAAACKPRSGHLRHAITTRNYVKHVLEMRIRPCQLASAPSAQSSKAPMAGRRCLMIAAP